VLLGLMLMDDELCDTVVMGVVQLQARSVWPLDAHPSRIRCERPGTLEQRLHTRNGRIAVCVTLIACIALHHHRRGPRAICHSLHSTLSATCTTRCDLYTTVLVQQ
jgi:hypothetical protein